jgi:hypothetical protein
MAVLPELKALVVGSIRDYRSSNDKRLSVSSIYNRLVTLVVQIIALAEKQPSFLNNTPDNDQPRQE